METELSVRSTALSVAKDLENHGQVSYLLKNATHIENYLINGYKDSKKDSPQSIIDSLKISNPTKGLITFKKYDHQKVLWTAIDNSKTLIINTSRMMGLTTLYGLYAVDYALKNPKSVVKVISNNMQCAKALAFMFNDQTSPESITQTKVTYNNGSTVTAMSSSSENKGNDESIDLLIVDNAAFIPFKDDAYINELIVSNVKDKCIISSSPNLDTGLFYTLWTTHSNYRDKVLLPWYMNSDRNPEWAKKTTEFIGPVVFAKEYCCQFLPQF